MDESTNKTVLIVEDEEILSIMLEKILVKLGYRVIKASNGQEGVDIFKKKFAEISGVILDMKMPLMDGKETFIAMKKIDKNVNALLSTGYGATEEAQEIIDLGAKGLLSKPYHINELSSKMSEIISKN